MQRDAAGPSHFKGLESRVWCGEGRRSAAVALFTRCELLSFTKERRQQGHRTCIRRTATTAVTRRKARARSRTRVLPDLYSTIKLRYTSGQLYL